MSEKKIRVLLDAGHYGKYNQSPVVPEYYESDMTWKLHLMLKEELEKYDGAEVLTTRDNKETDLAVYSRGKMAEGCDLFISLHSNASSDEAIDRVSVYCPLDGKNASFELGQRFADAVAELMEVSCGRVKTRQGDNGREYYGVLRGAERVDCPLYFIIEHSFHTNKKATRWLFDEDKLRELARLEADIIADWFGLAENYITGDVNGDGAITAKDYILAKRICFGAYAPASEELKRCDMDGDGKVTARDYILIKRAYFGTYQADKS